MARDTLDVDVLIVGGGPAGLSAALRLAQRQHGHGRAGASLSVAVIEKSREVAGHTLSGAVLDLSALRDLVPDFEVRGAPVTVEVTSEDVYLLSGRASVALPFIPPPLRNHGHRIISLNHFVRWLAEQVEAAGVDLFTGFSGRDVLFDGDRVVGIRTSDRGVSKLGQPKPHFEAGVDIRAKVTIFCDGVRGNLTKQVTERLRLGDETPPQQYALGIKELWDVPPGRVPTGRVLHTLGYPLRHDEFGGGFIYALAGHQLSVGFVAGLDYQDPLFDPHMAFNRFKQHPLVRSLLADGRLVRYGAKALPEGGWNTVPRPYMDGALIAGDAGGFLDTLRLKGIHLAMRTGMLAADTAIDAVAAGDTSATRLGEYWTRIEASAVKEELYPARGVHQAFGYGLVPGLLYSGLALMSGGRVPAPTGVAGHQRIRHLATYGYHAPEPGTTHPASNTTTIDRTLTFDKLTSVHFAGTAHEEDQPSHLVVDTNVCATRCRTEFGHPCVRFCPASVFEIARDTQGRPHLQVNASNCIHCKTCDIVDPYQAITWVPPEDGGPQYNGM